MQAGADEHLHAEFIFEFIFEFSFSPNWTSGAVLGANVSPTFVGADVSPTSVGANVGASVELQTPRLRKPCALVQSRVDTALLNGWRLNAMWIMSSPV